MHLDQLYLEFDYKKMAKTAALATGIGAAGIGAGIGAHSYLNKSQSTKGPEKITAPAIAAKAVDQGVDKSAVASSAKARHFADYIAKSEGIEKKVYDDGRGNLTIGIGHMLKDKSPAIFKKLFGDEVDYEAVASGKASLEKDQVYKLFEYDLDEHLDRARGIFTQFDTYPQYLQAALLDSVYRGDTGGKTARLINAGKWKEAAKEYLNRKDYKNRAALGIRGIGPRMERNRNAMLKYAQESAAH